MTRKSGDFAVIPRSGATWESVFPHPSASLTPSPPGGRLAGGQWPPVGGCGHPPLRDVILRPKAEESPRAEGLEILRFAQDDMVWGKACGRAMLAPTDSIARWCRGGQWPPVGGCGHPPLRDVILRPKAEESPRADGLEILRFAQDDMVWGKACGRSIIARNCKLFPQGVAFGVKWV